MTRPMTNQEALTQLYAAARLAALTADQHQHVARCAEVLDASLKSKEETKSE